MSRSRTVRLELCRSQRCYMRTEDLGLPEKHQAFQVQKKLYVPSQTECSAERFEFHHTPRHLAAFVVGIIVRFSNCIIVTCWEDGEILTTSVLVEFNLRQESLAN